MVDGTGNESEKKNKPMHMPEPAACICHAVKDALRVLADHQEVWC